MGRARVLRVGAVGTALATIVPLGAIGAPSAFGLMSPSIAALVTACNRGSGASGFATANDGRPLVGATVDVEAEPNPAHESVGQTVRLARLGSARTTAQGCYMTPLHASPGLLRSADRFGLVNLRITLVKGRSEQFVEIPVRLVSTGSLLALRAIGQGAPLLPSGLASRATSTQTLSGAVHQSFGPQATAARAQSSAKQASAAMAGPANITPLSDDGATSTVTQQLGAQPTLLLGARAVRPAVYLEDLVHVYAKHPVLVGQWWSRMKGVTETWSYSKGSSSELQIGVSISGKAGSFSSGSTNGKSSDATVTFPPAYGRSGVYYRTYWRYAKYKDTYCDALGHCKIHYEIRPYSWERGTQVTRHLAPPTVKRRNCSPYVADSWDNSGHGKAVTWTNGVEIAGDLKAILGASINLSSQTGFSTEAHNTVHFIRYGSLCGLFGPLGNHPAALEARRWG